jgi:hypothetical protein
VRLNRSLLNYLAIAILILGMATAEFIYWRALQNPAPVADLEDPYNSKVYEQTLERTIGAFGVIMDDCDRAFADLKEPRPLAITIAILTAATSSACFLTATRFPKE